MHAALGGVAGMSLGIPALRPTAARAQGSADAVGTLALADDLHVLTAGGANVVALTGVDGVVLVDGGCAELFSRDSRGDRRAYPAAA